MASGARARVGSGRWTFEAVPDWGRGAGGVPEFGTVSGLACDSRDNVYVFNRTGQPGVYVFTPDGALQRTWGADVFRHAHGIWIGPDATRGGEEVVLVTDRDLHQVIKYTLAGEHVRTWGAAYREPGDAGEPFNQPARATLGPAGEMFVADGYGQYRVHRFDPSGELTHSWGKRGTGPGEFGWPVHHALLDPRGRLLVCDRGNNRVQAFSPEGRYLTEWGGLNMPQDYALTPDGELICVEGTTPGVCVTDLDGNVRARWGERGSGPGQFEASPHSICLDSRGDLYVGEVVTPNRLQKFVRR
jgi:DNA-binding beta-propeller fold protein YncE